MCRMPPRAPTLGRRQIPTFFHIRPWSPVGARIGTCLEPSTFSTCFSTSVATSLSTFFNNFQRSTTNTRPPERRISLTKFNFQRANDALTNIVEKCGNVAQRVAKRVEFHVEKRVENHVERLVALRASVHVASRGARNSRS